MAQTVSEVLTAATDSVTLINAINTDASEVDAVNGMTQAEINELVQKNVDHLEIVLEYSPRYEGDDTPDVAGSDDDKTPYTDAITTGQTYITNNS